MNRKPLPLALFAALLVLPAASQASELSRRLTIRYPGQDAPKHRHRHHEEWHRRAELPHGPDHPRHEHDRDRW